MFHSFVLPFALAVGLVAASEPRGLVARAEPWDSWKPGVPWQMVIRESVDFSNAPPFEPSKAVVWDVDLFLTSAADIAKLKVRKSAGDRPRLRLTRNPQANNKIVLCHVSAGSVNTYDPDYMNFNGSLGNVAGYDIEEHYVDVADSAVVNFMKTRIELAAKSGCDGVDLDNVDAWFDDAIVRNLLGR